MARTSGMTPHRRLECAPLARRAWPTWLRLAVLAALIAGAALLAGCTPTALSTTPKPATAPPVTVVATAAPAPEQAAAASRPTTGPAPELPGYTLVFGDEFNDKKLDTKRWITSLPWGRTNRGEGQYYTPEALREGGGTLTFTAREQLTQGKRYSSGAISSRGLEFTYGRVEARVNSPAGAGLWPAFWLVTTSPTLNDEIDIMEILGSDPSLGHAVLHWGTTSDKHMTKKTYRNPDFSVGYHVFAVEWEPGNLVWYVDGLERSRITGDSVPSNPMRIITSLTVGGPTSWSGPPDRYTKFPAEMKVDYIRVYQRE